MLSGIRARADISRRRRRHRETEGIGQTPDHVEREANRERIHDLLAGSAGSQDCSHVFRIDYVLTRKLAEHH
jgi:hypothetical protein